MNARTSELSLLVFALILSVGVLIMTDLASGQGFAPDTIGFVAAFVITGGIAHVTVRRVAPNADPILLPVALFLTGFGTAFVRRLDSGLGGAQLTWTAVGLVVFVLTLTLARDHRVFADFRYSFLLIGIALLLLPMTPLGTDLGRAARLWVRVGGMTFQPAEVAKVVLALFLAGYLTAKRELMTLPAYRLGPIGIPAPRHFGPLALAWGLSMMVILYQRDLGMGLLYFALFLSAIYMATSRAIYVFAGLGLFAAGIAMAYDRFAHVQVRVASWLDPWSSDPDSGILAGGRQIAQSWYALGEGGMTGTGIGRGHPELIDPGLASGTLPTDFIFAGIGEELGLFGGVAILLLFGLLIARGFTIALRSTDTFGALLAGTLTFILGLQAFLILAGVTRLLPLTGITLPFISYGGSSLVTNMMIVALLIRISDREAVT